MGVSGSKHVLTLKGLKDERKGHEGEHEAHTKEHEEHKAVVDEKHGKLKGIIEQRRKEWAAAWPRTSDQRAGCQHCAHPELRPRGAMVGAMVGGPPRH